jgi:hypothetical protein
MTLKVSAQKCEVSQEAITSLARALAPEKDQDTFARPLTQAIEQLHEGSVARYRLKRSEFQAWQLMLSRLR